MNRLLSFHLLFLGIMFISFSNASAADDYIGGVPVRNYYGQPIPDMFEITEQGFEGAISDLGRGAKDLVDDIRAIEKGKRVRIPWGLPKAMKVFAKAVNFWARVFNFVNDIHGDERIPSPEDIPSEVGSDETPRNRGSLDDPASWKPDYTGDFPEGFGDDHSGTS